MLDQGHHAGRDISSATAIVRDLITSMSRPVEQTHPQKKHSHATVASVAQHVSNPVRTKKDGAVAHAALWKAMHNAFSIIKKKWGALAHEAQTSLPHSKTGAPTNKPAPPPTPVHSQHTPTPQPPLKYDPRKFPTQIEARVSGPVGYWKRLPIPDVRLQKDGHASWWPQKQAINFLDHNILMETGANDPHFDQNAIETPAMHRWLHGLTNGMRRLAIIQCAVALQRFMDQNFPDGDWWLEGGSLVGSLRAPHEFIPWDSDADVTMMEETWNQVTSLLQATQHTAHQPNREGEPCGCLLLDTTSFGSHRHGYNGRNQIPGRVINECTGNYVDIFNGIDDEMGRVALSQQPVGEVGSRLKGGGWFWDRSIILPPRTIKFEGFPFKVPHHPWKYLDAYRYGRVASKPDHVWDAQHKRYVDSLMFELEAEKNLHR
jgi:hypothetical protein